MRNRLLASFLPPLGWWLNGVLLLKSVLKSPQLFGDKISEEEATLKGSLGWALNLDWDPKRGSRQRHPGDDHGCKPRTGHREEPGLKFPS